MSFKPGKYTVPKTGIVIKLISWSRTPQKGEKFSLSGWWKIHDLTNCCMIYASGDMLREAGIIRQEAENEKVNQ